MPLADKVAVQDHPTIGKGIFAVERIEKGEVVWWWDVDGEHLTTYSRAEITKIQGEEGEWLRRYSYFVDEDLFGSQPRDQPMDVAYYFNHTCDPNCWYDGDEKLIAMRTILPGEHVAYDYAMTETELSNHAGMQCLCGAASCRGLLTFKEYRDPEWLAKYEAHSESFIKRKAKEQGVVNAKIYLRHEKPNQPPRGLYALDKIAKGEVCVVFAGPASVKVETVDQVQAHQRAHTKNGDKFNVAQLVGSEIQEKSDQVNHSCTPSTVFQDSVTLVAARDIDDGEEITFDYSLLIAENTQLDCSCGSAGCRKTVQRTQA